MEYLPPFICLINRGSCTSRSHQYKSRRARGRLGRAPGVLPNIDKEVKTTKFYTSKPTWYAYPEGDEQRAPRDRHATISVLKFKASEPVYDHRCEIDEPRLSSSEFWNVRGGLTSYSDLQEDFFNKISCKYGAVRGESKSLLKNTNAEQAKRFDRSEGDLYNELPPFNDLPY